MHDALNGSLYLVKEHVGMLKAANNYDIYDAETNEVVMHCREPNLGIFSKLFRFSDCKRMTPFDIEITTPSGEPVCRVTRGISIFLSKVSVYDENEVFIGGFKQKLFSIGGAFSVLNPNEEVVCTLKGKWTSWDFRFLTPSDVELAHVAKKWAGLGKELFTSADNYALSISDSVPVDNPIRQLILGAVMCIDMVLKE